MKKRRAEEKKAPAKKRKQTKGRQVEVDGEAERLQARKEVLARDLIHVKDKRERASVSVSKCETEIATLMRNVEKLESKLKTTLAKLESQRDELLKRELKVLDAEEDVRTTKRDLDSVQQRMVQRTLPPLPETIYLEVAKHVHESEAFAVAMTCRGFRDAMKESLGARKGNTATADKWLRTSWAHYHSFEGVPVSEDWIKWAVSMKWEYDKERDENEKIRRKFLTYLAGRGGFRDVLVWLKSQRYFRGSQACSGAAQGGHIKILKYLKSEGVKFDPSACEGAAKGGHIDVLKYLKGEGVWPGDEAAKCAAQEGHIDVLKYLLRPGDMCGDLPASHGAAERGRIDVLKYLVSVGGEFNSETCQNAAAGGHIDVLKYLKSVGRRIDRGTCRAAATAGRLDVLKYLQSEGVPFDDEQACQSAAYGGHLDVLRYLRSEGCPWNERVCLLLAGKEEIEMRQWIQSHINDPEEDSEEW